MIQRDPCWAIASVVSLVVFVATLIVIVCRGKNKHVDRSKSRWTIFAAGVFFATFILNLGLYQPPPESALSSPIQQIEIFDRVLWSAFNTIQMFDAGRDLASLSANEASEPMCALVWLYVELLFVLSPVAFLGAVATYLVRFFGLTRVRIRSWFHSDTYVFSELNEHAVTLATSIRGREDGKLWPFRRANLVFASVDRDAGSELQTRAAGIGALCVGEKIEGVWRTLFGHWRLRLVLIGKNEVENITRAASIRSACELASAKRGNGWPLKVIRCCGDALSRVRSALCDKGDSREAAGKWLPSSGVLIYSVTSLYGAESLLVLGDDVAEQANQEAQADHVVVRARRVDWTRSLVESVLTEHPLFLLGKQPDVKQAESGEGSAAYKAWQNGMFACKKRHVVIVGAGHVGMGFLRRALSLSRFQARDSAEALSFRFDVFDNVPDPLDKTKCLAQQRFEGEAPYYRDKLAGEEFNTHFHLLDVLGPKFEEVLKTVNDWHGGITYLIVCLGDDLVTAQAAIRIREMLERMRVRKAAQAEAGKRREAYCRSLKPIILTVVDDNELAGSLARAQDDGFDYQIEPVGTDEQTYTFESIIGGEEMLGKSEYKLRSSRASDQHKKYKLYAWMADMGQEDDVRGLCVDWSADFVAKAKSGDNDDTLKAIKAYNTYASTGEDGGAPTWLCRMEHDRWNAYMWGEGFLRASVEEVETFFSTCQPEERHRLNGADLHPCVVPFDRLDELDDPIDKLYIDAIEDAEQRDDEGESDALLEIKRFDKDYRDFMEGSFKPFQLADVDYLQFERK